MPARDGAWLAHTTLVEGLLLRSLLGLQRGLLGDEPLHAVEPLRVEPTVGHRCAHGAIGFVVVLAVAEATVIHQLEDIGERILDAAATAPQADGAHAGRVDEPPVVGAGQLDEFSSEAVVVCRPRWSPSRTSAVIIRP